MQVGKIVFEKYEIIREMKTSELVSVYEARHIYLHSSWVIKKINAHHPLYIKEVEILKSLNHESIPLITDVFLEGDQTYIIREYIDGSTLGEIIREQGVMTENQVLHLGIQICQVLEYLHTHFEQPLIYRDIKPDNIILSNQNQIKLIDFGIARFYQGNKDADTEYLGTRGFAAPEQYGIGQTDIRTDVFGVGILLYYLLTQKNLMSTSIRLEPIRFYRDDVSGHIERIIQKASQFNVEERYTSIIELKNALQYLQEVQSVANLGCELINHKEKIITVSGIKSGIGTTHVAMTLATYIESCQKKCVFLDMSEAQEMMSLEYTQEAYVEFECIHWNGLKILSGKDKDKKVKMNIKNILETCDWIIIDCGKEDERKKKDIHGVQSIVVTGIAPWEMTRFDDMLMTNSRDEHVYFVNFSSGESVREIEEVMPEIRCYAYPYAGIDEEINAIYQSFYSQIFQEWGQAELCLTSSEVEAFSGIEKFKTKFLKSIKTLRLG